MMRRGIVVSAVVAATLAAMPLQAAMGAQGEPVGPPACPLGFDYTMTLDQALVRYAGYVPEEQIREVFANYDKNGNGFVCYDIRGMYTYYPFVYFFLRDDLVGFGPAQ